MQATRFVKNERLFELNDLFKRILLLMGSGFSLAILAALASSSKAIFIKLIYTEVVISPLELLTLRLLISLPFFIWLAYGFKANSLESTPRRLTVNSLMLIFWLGFCGYYFASLADFIGLQYISSSLERLVLFTYPAIVIVIEALWFKRWPGPKTWLGISLSYSGVLVAFGHDLQQYQDPDLVLLGVGWVFLSGFSFALYYLGASKAINHFGARRFVGLAGISATGITLTHYLFNIGGGSDSSGLSLSQLSPTIWLYISLLALLCTILPSLLMAAAINRIGASATARIGMLGPMMTMLLGWWILAESFSGWQLAGLVLVILGISQVSKEKR